MKTIIVIIFSFFLSLSVIGQNIPKTYQLGTIDELIKYVSLSHTFKTDGGNSGALIHFTLVEKTTVDITASGTFDKMYKISPPYTAFDNNNNSTKSKFRIELEAGDYYTYCQGSRSGEFSESSFYAFIKFISYRYVAPVPPPPPLPPDYSSLPNQFPKTASNYIMTSSPLVEMKEIKFDSNQELVDIQYFDGLGRITQTVHKGKSPSKNDLVTLHGYDYYGRNSEQWNPSVLTNNNGMYADPDMVKKNLLNFAQDSVPYSKPIYERSPLNRVLQQYAPGEDWHTKSKATKIDYLANVSGDKNLNSVLYNVGGTSQNPTLSKQNNYPSGELYVTKTTDEDGNASFEFKDKLDQVVLTRQINNGNNYDTYYVYDDFGNLCFVLPPRIQSAGISQDSLNSLAYQYQYDSRNRCVWKKLPGCEAINYVYDKADQLVYTQDGEQRSRGEWLFSISDAFGRPALSGIIKDEDVVKIDNQVIKAEYTGISTNRGYLIKVDNASITFPIKSLLSVNYYDNYDFLGKNDFTDQAYDQTQETNGFGKRYDEGNYAVKGQLTGSIIALFGNDVASNSFLYTTMYYDNRARVIQTRSTNHLGGKEIECVAYNFTGQPIETLHIHTDRNQKETIEKYYYHYDHALRLIETEHQINELSRMTLSKNSYDELGRLQNKIIGGNKLVNTNQ